MNKQGALDQRVWNRGTVDGNDWTVPARGELVDELSRDPFSGSAFAGDQDRCIGGSDAFDQAHDPAHRCGLANHDDLLSACSPSTLPTPPQWTNSRLDSNTSTA